jgi:hypothetical protein
VGTDPDKADQPPRDIRPLHAEIPTELHKRMGRYRADTGETLTKQVEIAVDEWLTEKGY